MFQCRCTLGEDNHTHTHGGCPGKDVLKTKVTVKGGKKKKKAFFKGSPHF